MGHKEHSTSNEHTSAPHIRLAPVPNRKRSSQTSSSDGSSSKRSQSDPSSSEGAKCTSMKLSDCGALNLVKHNRRPPPITEESDQTVPTLLAVKSGGSGETETAKSSPERASKVKQEI